MKRCGRPRKNFKAATATQVIQYPESGLPQSAPIIGSLVESGEFNLLDLSRLQAELEHLLASATERMVCLSSELTGTPLPPSILRHLGLLEAEELTHPCPIQAPSSLVVTANPNKPLSLIISSQRRQSADVQPPEARLATNENSGSLPVPVPAVPPSSSPSATEKGSNPAHDVPNRFWALMEPYCADITETNISYLESILKSYVEEATTAKYFQLPPEPNNATDHNLRSAHHSPDHHVHAPKRPRRDCQKTPQNNGDLEASEHSELSGALKAATEMVQLARCIDAQLKQPSLSSTTSVGTTAVEDLVHSIENELYQENVSSVLCSAVTHMAKGEFCPGSPGQANFLPNHHTNDRKSPCLLDAYAPSSPNKLNGGGAGLPHFPDRVCDSLTSLTTQPLKNLARQLQVSSSFRVEKKVAQAMEELGLFPLTLYLNHLAQRPASPLLPAHLPPPLAARWRSVASPPCVRGGNSTQGDCKTEPTSPPPVNNRETGRYGAAPTDSKATHPVAGERTTASEHHHRVNGSAASKPPQSLKQQQQQLVEQAVERGRSLSTTSATASATQPCTRNSRRNSQSASTAPKRSKSQSESPLLNGFAESEDGDEERVEEADGQEEADEEDRAFLENGDVERNGTAATAAEEEDSGDMTDGGPRGTYDSADADLEEAAAVGTGGDGGRSSAAVSRCLAEDFEAAAASDNPQCSPQHRASLRGPTAATAAATASKRVCNAKKWLTSLSAKQAPDASEAADTAPGRGYANPKVNAIGGSEKSCAFANLFNSGLDLAAGEHPNQPAGGCCERLDELASAVPPDDDDDLSGCLLNLAAAAASAAAATAAATEQTGGGDLSALAPSSSNSDVTLALLQRQRELRLVCAANHSVLHRLIQAARRDLQRQEIQRRLAIADADVIEAYNKLESYRVLHRPALKRDRDAAWKTLKERQKIRAELEAFDRKAP